MQDPADTDQSPFTDQALHRGPISRLNRRLPQIHAGPFLRSHPHGSAAATPRLLLRTFHADPARFLLFVVFFQTLSATEGGGEQPEPLLKGYI